MSVFVIVAYNLHKNKNQPSDVCSPPQLQIACLSRLSSKVMALILCIFSVALATKASMAQNYDLIRAIPNPDPVNTSAHFYQI